MEAMHPSLQFLSDQSIQHQYTCLWSLIPRASFPEIATLPIGAKVGRSGQFLKTAGKALRATLQNFSYLALAELSNGSQRRRETP